MSSNQTGALSDQTCALSDQTGALSDQTGALPGQAGALSDQTGAMSDQTGALKYLPVLLRRARVDRHPARMVGLHVIPQFALPLIARGGWHGATIRLISTN